jgi:hypothetical protein
VPTAPRTVEEDAEEFLAAPLAVLAPLALLSLAAFEGCA